jgi:hypothetical protein
MGRLSDGDGLICFSTNVFCEARQFFCSLKTSTENWDSNFLILTNDSNKIVFLSTK